MTKSTLKKKIIKMVIHRFKKKDEKRYKILFEKLKSLDFFL